MFQCKMTHILADGSFALVLSIYQIDQNLMLTPPGKQDNWMIHVCFGYAENSKDGIKFFHLGLTVIYYRSRTVTRHWFFMKLNHPHPCAAKSFHYVQK